MKDIDKFYPKDKQDLLVFVKYNKDTMEVEGFFTYENLEEDTDYILINRKIERSLVEMANENMGTLFVKDIDNKEFESRVVKLEYNPYIKQEEENRVLKEELEQLKAQMKEMNNFINMFREAETLK